MNEMLYDVAIEGKDYQIRIPWGEGKNKNWINVYREELDNAHRISLIPKDHVEGMPVVTVRLDDDRRWILFSRVVGRLIKVPDDCPKSNKIRLYCLGWQKTVKGVNVKSLQWVYPSGSVEIAEEPSFFIVDKLLTS